MKRKVISFLLTAFFVLSASVTSFAANFKDVGSNFSWASEAIIALSENGIISGYADGSFKPGNNITKEEAVALFAKALGYNEEVYESIVTLADELYAPLLENYKSYAVSNAAYLLYKRVLTTDDIVTYMTTANKNQTLKRYEAATLIARALGADTWLKSNPDFSLEYKDSTDIPESAKAYVYYASNKGIMTGTGNNIFEPSSSVTRAQIATMIHRILGSMEFTYTSGMVANIEPTLNTVTIKQADGATMSYNVGKDVTVMINGEQSQITLLETGLEVVMTKSGDKLYALDAVRVIPDEDIVGIYKGKMTTNTATTIKIADLATSTIEEYKLSDDVVITYEGKAAALSSYNNNDYIRAQIRNGAIVIIDGEPKNVTVSDLIVEAIEFVPDAVIRFRDKDNELLSYSIKSGATLKRNGSGVDFSKLAVGDKVTVSLEYGLISSALATGLDKSINGTIEEFTISKNTSYIIINTGTQSITYTVSRDVKVEVDGKAATLYDLRLGASVDFTTTSSTITELSVKSVASAAQVTGVVKLVNTSYGMVVVSTTDTLGNVSEQQIFIRSTSKILDSNDGKIKTVKDIAVGQKIMAAGAVNTGIFEATSIIILAQ